MDKTPNFNSVEDECRFWKEKAKFYHKEWQDAKQEFDEFVEDSRQLEAEMESTLEQKENLIRDLRKQQYQLENESESLRVKNDSHAIEQNNLEKQLTSLQTDRESMRTYTRQLEQKNDDLERTNRILVESLADFQLTLDKQYEKNALLEIEVDQKEILQEEIQRLKDEKRDLKHELKVVGPTNNSTIVATTNNMNGSIDGSLEQIPLSPTPPRTPVQLTTNLSLNHINNHHQNNFHQLQQQQQQNNHQLQQQQQQQINSLRNSDNLLNGNAMTPSSRTTALNIVADMLRKLNAMESKLKAYREQSTTISTRK